MLIRFDIVSAKRIRGRRDGDKGVTEQLDEAYGKAGSKVDSALSAMQIPATRKRDDW